MAIEALKQALKQFDEKQEKLGLEHRFDEIDRRALAKMDDKKLALWQSQYPESSPQFILAQYEWNRRLTADQIKAARWSAWFGIFGAIIGSLLTLLAQFLSQ